MRKKAQNSNKQFLIGTAAMAFAVLAVVGIFIYLCLPYMSKHESVQAKLPDTYRIEFAQGFSGDSAIVYLNDSLLWEDYIPTDTLVLHINRFANENTLMVSRSREDAVSIFNIGIKSGRLILHRKQGEISMTPIAE